MFEHQNYSDLEELNQNFLELQHTVMLFLYIMCSIVILTILFLLCLTYANYIHSKKARTKLKDEINLNLLKHSENESENYSENN